MMLRMHIYTSIRSLKLLLREPIDVVVITNINLNNIHIYQIQYYKVI